MLYCTNMTQTPFKTSKERFKVLDRIRGAFKNVPVEEVEQEVSKAIKEARADRRYTTHK